MPEAARSDRVEGAVLVGEGEWGRVIGRLKQEVGYQPQYTIERAVGEYIDWLRQHPE